ncbi:predicted protein [Naegleria gruberi]|uniref:Predicted protein n=1 Tax=Naegleria gruberi TaxID=5762 RepID=D2VIF6_NAEGR|nr:uncharacterized protein NAEGRDRAFT_49807 [Naegleria gruberi]EFC43351.1 predicted protein [Naegleria gruberi]|eukprot:XP_002676095.1 predicted protein [Naegleria gruberi strain NEG-M]
MECLSDEFATTEARTYSRKAHRKKVRGIFGQTGKENKLDLETQFPARDQKYWKTHTMTDTQIELQIKLSNRTQDLKELEEAKHESKHNAKQKHQNEKFEEWCATKSKKKIRKKQKQLEREGLSTPFDNDSTSSEVEEKVEEWYKDNSRGVTEVKKYYETDSLMCFKYYREFKVK